MAATKLSGLCSHRLKTHGQLRSFSSGIRQILRAIVNQADEDEANVAKQLSGRHTDKAKGKGKEPSALVKAMIERSKPRIKEQETAPPVKALRARERWACMAGCGACCLLEKGPQYPPIEEILTDPSEVALYKSMIGKDGWCKNFDKYSRKCTIYNDRPRFCRIEPEIFEELYGVGEHRLDKEACRLCRDSITDVYGCKSKELKNFERLIASMKK